MRLMKRDLFLNELYQMAIVYSAPAGLTYLWNFGSMALVSLVIQIFTGIFLAMFYTNSVFFAFDSIEHIMRDVPLGWLIRYIHANGASMFFLTVYLHLCRGLFFCSFYTPRYKLWISGILILFLMMGTAFMGYVLPWGQMSFWAATVITNLASAIPYYGNEIVFWFWGAFSVDVPTLGRFFSLHYLLPFVLVGLVAVHLIILHDSKSSDGLGLNVLSIDRVPFGVYYLVKDVYGFIFYAILFSILVFFYPNLLGHSDNYIEANPMVTPVHIVPEWYFLPFYAILRAIPDKLYGVILMIFSIVFIALFPFFLHVAKRTNFVPQSGFHRVLFRRIIIRFVICFILLGWLGGQPAAGIYITLGVILTVFFFFVLTVNLYFILIKEVFVYSNHYLIISKLTQENFKDYFTYEPIDDDYTGTDETSYNLYDYHDYIDLSIYEFESADFVIFKNDHLESENDKNYLLGEQDENIIDYYNYDKIINDQLHRSLMSEPFVSIYWCVPFTFFADIKPTDEEEDIEFKELQVFQSTSLTIDFKEEDLEKTFFFPKNEKFVYYLNNNTYNYIPESDDFEEEGDDLNHIINQDYCLDLDSIELEYWHEPLFVFPLIREMHFHRDEKDFFSDLYTSPVNVEWFNTNEFDHSTERYA